jgi:glycosyltransferase involved in cell wall biosynthesis
MPDVSVIIPTKNRPMLLERAVASVVQQKSTFTHECIIIDDGNTDNAALVMAVAERAGARYFTTAENGERGGGGAARNLGSAHAKGRYIAFLDDDDEWLPGKLEFQLKFMVQTGYSMSYTGITIVDTRGRRRYSFRLPPYENQYRSIGTTSTLIVSKDSLSACGGFDPSLPALQDYDLYIRLLEHYRTGWLTEPLTTYYTEQTSQNTSAGRDRFYAARTCLSKKYANDRYFYLMKRYFLEIFLLKCFRSPQFLSETLRSLVKR